MKSEFVRARIEPDLKSDVYNILDELGITVSQAINMFFKAIQRDQTIPFDIGIPNKKTLQTFKETDEGRNLNYYENSNDLFKKLGI